MKEPKRYRVELSRTAYQYATVEVEASSEKEAEKRAWEKVDDDDWETSNSDDQVDSVEEIDNDY